MPLILPVNEEDRPMLYREIVLIKKEIQWIFKCKETKRDDFLKSIRQKSENYIQKAKKRYKECNSYMEEYFRWGISALKKLFLK